MDFFSSSLGFASKSEVLSPHSAEGAEYDSQGQAPSGARRVAPGPRLNNREALKERNNQR